MRDNIWHVYAAIVATLIVGVIVAIAYFGFFWHKQPWKDDAGIWHNQYVCRSYRITDYNAYANIGAVVVCFQKEEQVMEELLTVHEVAEQLRVDDTTVRRWIKQGTLEAISLPHIGTRQAYRVRRSTIETLLAA